MKTTITKLATLGIIAILSVGSIGSAAAKGKGKPKDASAAMPDKITEVNSEANTVTVSSSTGAKVISVTPATKIYKVDSTEGALTDLTVGTPVNLTMSDATTALEIRVASDEPVAKKDKKDKKSKKSKKGDSSEN